MKKKIASLVAGAALLADAHACGGTDVRPTAPVSTAPSSTAPSALPTAGTVGSFRYSVTKVESTTTLAADRTSEGVTATPPAGTIFLVVRVTVTNVHNTPAHPTGTGVLLRDDAGRFYAPTTKAPGIEGSTEDSGNPGVTYRRTVTFVVPAGTVARSITLPGGDGSSVVLSIEETK